MEISSHGDLRDRTTLRKISTRPNDKGYIVAGIKVDGLKTTARINRLVLIAFVGPMSHPWQAAHINGVRDDNRIENLRWETPLENAADRHGHGTQVRGEQINTAKLCASDVIVIKARMLAGESDPDIASAFGMDRKAISKIRNGRTWKHVEPAGAIGYPAGFKSKGFNFRKVLVGGAS